MIENAYFFGATAVAAIGTSVWAVGVSRHDIDVRYPLVVAGLLSGISLYSYPATGTVSVYANTGLGIVLVMYQYFISESFKEGGPSAQAAINCNVLFICAYQVFWGHIPATIELFVLAWCAFISMTAFVWFNHLERIPVDIAPPP